MGHIWKLIVADPKKAIDEHYDVIVDDLLVQSGSRLWRSREASCLALADIIQGRRYSQVSNYFEVKFSNSALSHTSYAEMSAWNCL